MLFRPSYRGRFQKERDARTRAAAERIVDIVLAVLPGLRSAVDVGCGVGTWLSVLRAKGVEDLLGIDGAWIEPRELRIPEEQFRAHDLSTDLELFRRFDLAICLEVAEHLPPERAEGLVLWLTRLADCVLFSAAIPGQGGRGHRGERWQSEWAEFFHRSGYLALDVVRPQIWNDPSIQPWYRQNTFLFVRSERVAHLRLPPTLPPLLSVVHPELFTYRLRRAATLGGVLRRWRRGISRLSTRFPSP